MPSYCGSLRACACCALALLVCGGLAAAADGDSRGPVGGGPGFNDEVVGAEQATTTVSTAKDLATALGRATSGTTVYVADSANINMNSYTGLRIKAGVTLASGRGKNGSKGGRLFITTTSATTMLVITGRNVRITGLRIAGPSETTSSPMSYGIAAQGHPGVRISNCELSGWGAAAVGFLAGSTNCEVDHCFFHGNTRKGLGYGVSMGRGTTSTRRIDVKISYNTFGNHRHCIASAGDAFGSYTAVGNSVSGTQVSHVFDRHGTLTPGTWWGGVGGDYTIVQNNKVATNIRSVSVRGVPTKRPGLQVKGNTFRCTSQSACIQLYAPSQTSTYSISGNSFGVSGGRATSTATPLRISSANARAPARITFETDLSTTTSWAGWDFGDGQSIDEATKVTHAYPQPGLFFPKLTSFDDSGMPTFKTSKLLVYPQPGKYVVSAWVMDNFAGNTTGQYEKQILVDDQVVWSQDVAADGDWVHVSQDISEQVKGKTSVKLSLRVRAKTTVPPQDPKFEVYFDDVFVFGGDVADDGTFEKDSSAWSFAAEGDNGWRGLANSDGAHSGERAFSVWHAQGEQSDEGSAGTVSRNVVLGSTDYPMGMSIADSAVSASVSLLAVVAVAIAAAAL